MAEEQSLADKIMSKIKKQTVINGIKELFRRFPQAKMILPFAKDSIANGKLQVMEYLGNDDKMILIVSRGGMPRIIVMDAKKPYIISPEKISSSVPLLLNKTIEDYEKELMETGIFEEMTDEDKINYEAMRNKLDGQNLADLDFSNIGQTLKSFTDVKQLIEPKSFTEKPID